MFLKWRYQVMRMSLKRWLKGLQRAREPSWGLEEGTVLTLYTLSTRFDDWELKTRCPSGSPDAV